MIRPMLSLDRLTFLEPAGKVGYRWAGTPSHVFEQVVLLEAEESGDHF